MLRAYLFGGLTLTWHDGPLPTIPSRTARSLLAHLLTYRDQPHSRDLLAGTFWPDTPDATARRRLSQALWQIRNALEPHAILLTEGDAVQLNPDLPFVAQNGLLCKSTVRPPPRAAQNPAPAVCPGRPNRIQPMPTESIPTPNQNRRASIRFYVKIERRFVHSPARQRIPQGSGP